MKRLNKIVFIYFLFIISLFSCITKESDPLVPLSNETLINEDPEENNNVESDNLLNPNEPPPPGAEDQFKTNFSRHTVPYSEILSGGPVKDGIPPIDNPIFININEAAKYLNDNDPVLVLDINGFVHVYPLEILIWHEIVNDIVDGVEAVITYCPLCNTGIAFKREYDGIIFDFGTSGFLRYSNLIMYDRQTETWWQQATGEGIAGQYADEKLLTLPILLLSFKDVKYSKQDVLILSRETGYNRPYGTNPYANYDTSEPFLYRGPDIPESLSLIERVLVVTVDEESVVFPYPVLSQSHIVSENINNEQIVVFWESGTSSALDSSLISDGRNVGSANAFNSVLDNLALTFIYQDNTIKDLQTGSTWTINGVAVDGELVGRKLMPVIGVQHFWFSASAFISNARLYEQ